MTTMTDVLQDILALGAPVLLPIVILVVGLVVRQRPGQALMSAMKIGIGFALINVALGAFFDAIVPATTAMLERSGLHRDVIDVGWPTLATIGWGSQFGILVIPLFIVVNLIMLALKWTMTFNVDIWNFWHIAYAAALVTFASRSFVLGLVAAVIVSVVVLRMADFTQKRLSEYIGVPGISITTLEMISHAWVAIGMNRLLDTAFPAMKRMDISLEGLRGRLGILAEPTLHGILVGALLGALAGYRLPAILSLAIMVAAILHLFPMVVMILLDGLKPLADSASVFFKGRYAGRNLFIGMDWIILLKPETLALGVLFVPIALGLAFILPGVRVIPVIDMPFIGFVLSLALPYTNRNLLKTVVIGLVEVVVSLYVASAIAPFVTGAAQTANVAIPEGATLITGFLKGGDYFVSALAGVASFIGNLFGG